MQKFQLTTKELASAGEFLAAHEAQHGPNEIRQGPRYIFELWPTGVATGVTIRCNTCKHSSDISDYDVW
jgi:hypothetical protein